MKTKFNLDRRRLDSSYIQSRQDFDKVINGYRAMKPPIWKNPWFYGPAGLASIAILFILSFQNNYFANEKISTLESKFQKNNISYVQKIPCVFPPNESVNIPFENFTINPENGGHIITSRGTKISIPKGSLMTKNRKPVNILIREFEDMTSTFVAGIPMDYGQKSAFESGGMIEIRGIQNNRPVKINPHLPIHVDMRLHKSGNDFNFYALNDETGEWKEYPCSFTSNQAKPSENTSPSVEIANRIHSTNTKIEICEKELQLLKKDEAKTRFIPTPNARKVVIDFDPKQLPELAGFKNIEFEYVYPKNQSKEDLVAFERRIKIATTTVWNDVKIVRNKEYYTATFTNNRESYTLPVRPVLKGQSLIDFENQLAQVESAKKELIAIKQLEKKELESKREQLQKQHEDLLRTMQKKMMKTSNKPIETGLVSQTNHIEKQQLTTSYDIPTADERVSFSTIQFGIFNCDRPFHYPKPFEMEVVCQNESGIDIHMTSAYLFDLKEKVQFTYGLPKSRSITSLAWTKNPSLLILIDHEGNFHHAVGFNKSKYNGEAIRFKQINKNKVNLDEIKKLIRETAALV